MNRHSHIAPRQSKWSHNSHPMFCLKSPVGHFPRPWLVRPSPPVKPQSQRPGPSPEPGTAYHQPRFRQYFADRSASPVMESPLWTGTAAATLTVDAGSFPEAVGCWSAPICCDPSVPPHRQPYTSHWPSLGAQLTRTDRVSMSTGAHLLFGPSPSTADRTADWRARSPAAAGGRWFLFRWSWLPGRGAAAREQKWAK